MVGDAAPAIIALPLPKSISASVFSASPLCQSSSGVTRPDGSVIPVGTFLRTSHGWVMLRPLVMMSDIAVRDAAMASATTLMAAPCLSMFSSP